MGLIITTTEENKHLPTDIETGYSGMVDANEIQSINTAHSLMKLNLENKGYVVTMDLI